MQNVANHGKMLIVKDGFIVCPNCRKRMHNILVTQATNARDLSLQCDRCKAVIKVNIDRGQCTRCPSPDQREDA